MFKTLILLYARSFWETGSRPKPGRSFPHWLATMSCLTQNEERGGDIEARGVEGIGREEGFPGERGSESLGRA